MLLSINDWLSQTVRVSAFCSSNWSQRCHFEVGSPASLMTLAIFVFNYSFIRPIWRKLYNQMCLRNVMKLLLHFVCVFIRYSSYVIKLSVLTQIHLHIEIVDKTFEYWELSIQVIF